MTANGSAVPGKAPQKASAPPSRKTTWFELPASIRRIFDKFPLVIYAENGLPQRVPRDRREHVLYIFQDPQSNNAASLSCNPSCLKWQAFLRFRNVKLRLRDGNNHASPSGALPFVLPANEDGRPKSPIPASKLPRWLVAQGGREEGRHIQEEAYMALIDHSIRNAWLHYLYIDKENFHSVAWPLYVTTASRSTAVQYATAHRLRAAAVDELYKTTPIIHGEELYELADDAFKALSILLGSMDYFFGEEEPGLFDASVFAYSHLLLDTDGRWRTRNLVTILSKYDNLVEHRDRIIHLELLAVRQGDMN